MRVGLSMHFALPARRMREVLWECDASSHRFGILKAFAKQRSDGRKFVCVRVGRMRRHIILRLTALTLLARRRCIENCSLIPAQNSTCYGTQLSS
jgi:hypothetical protein